MSNGYNVAAEIEEIFRELEKENNPMKVDFAVEEICTHFFVPEGSYYLRQNYPWSKKSKSEKR